LPTTVREMKALGTFLLVLIALLLLVSTVGLVGSPELAIIVVLALAAAVAVAVRERRKAA
jgi:hypothetical protein